jgi:hypothetical protein
VKRGKEMLSGKNIFFNPVYEKKEQNPFVKSKTINRTITNFSE